MSSSFCHQGTSSGNGRQRPFDATIPWAEARGSSAGIVWLAAQLSIPPSVPATTSALSAANAAVIARAARTIGNGH